MSDSGKLADVNRMFETRSYKDLDEIEKAFARYIGTLRAGGGITQARFMKRTGLVERTRRVHNLNEAPASEVFQAFLSDLDNFCSQEDLPWSDRKGLLALIATSGRDSTIRHPDLETRRARFAKWVSESSSDQDFSQKDSEESGTVVVQVGTVFKWEADAIRSFASFLAKDWPFPQEVGETEQAPPAAYETVGSQYELHFNGGGVLEQEKARRVIVARELLSQILVSHSYASDRRPGVVKIRRGSYCKLEIVEETPDGAVTAICQFSPPLAPSSDADGFEFGYSVDIDSDVRSKAEVRHIPRTRETNMTIVVNFDLSFAPDEVWWYEDQFVRDTPGKPSPERTIRVERGSAAWTFPDLRADRCYGLAWYWPAG